MTYNTIFRETFCNVHDLKIKLVKTLQELAESEPEAYSKD